MTALGFAHVAPFAPTCEHDGCDRADLAMGLCGAHGVDCVDCGVRFDPWDLVDGLCRECTPSEFAEYTAPRTSKCEDKWSV